MDRNAQTGFLTSEEADGIELKHHRMTDIKPTLTCGSEQNERIIVSSSEMGAVKIEDDLTDGKNRDRGMVPGVEERKQAEIQITSVLTLHRPEETGSHVTLRKTSADKFEDNAGRGRVVNSTVKRSRQRKSPRQEEMLERRRSLRHARDEDLAGLQVQFGDMADNSAGENETASWKKTEQIEKSSQPRGRKPQMVKESSGRRGRKPRMTTRSVDVGSKVWEQWHQIGTEQGLHSDADIAAMLVRHYQTTDAKLCTTCQSPLQLLCPSCPPSQPPSLPTPTPTLTESCPPPSSPKASPEFSPSPSPEPVVEEEETEDVEVKPLPSQPEEPVKRPSRRGRKRKQEQQSHVCSDCGAMFARAAALKVHMRKHTGEKPFNCTECNRSFTTSGQLVNHRRKHTGERPYVCSVCSATFPIASSLKQHSRIHTGDRPYACHVCQQRFCYRGDLTAHVRKHTGDRPFLCSDCGKSFAMSSHLSKHKRIHSGYRPFECNVCHKTFPFLNRLTLHMRTHTGEKPFLCADCGSSFIRASTLTIHRRIHHTFEKPCICPYCNHAFADSANLSKHKKYKHGAQKMAAKQLPTTTSLTQLQEKPSFSDVNAMQVNVDATVVSGSVVECGDKVCSEVSALQMCGNVSGSEGLTVGEGDAPELEQLKPVGPWKPFQFPL